MAKARRAALLCLLALALPALPLVASLPPHPRILGVLNNAAHGPVFGAFAMVVLALLRRFTTLAAHGRYLAALAIALGVGGAIALVQPAIGRGFEWSDLWRDAIGAIAGLALAAHSEFRTAPVRWRRRIALVVALAAMAISWPVVEASLAYAWRAARYPVLFQASTPFDRYFIHRSGADISSQLLPAKWRREGDPVSLRVRLVGGPWPGVALVEPIADWNGHARLMLDLTNPDTAPLALRIRVHDLAHDRQVTDRFSRKFQLEPLRRQVVAIPLEDIARGPRDRALDLSRVAGIIVFGESHPALIGRTFFITRIWLE